MEPGRSPSSSATAFDPMKTLVALLTLLSLSHRVDAQAYCALRDPNRQIFELFPQADSFRSIVRTIGEATRQDVAERLPFTLHFNELGRHTVYVAQKEGQTLGLVHVRSEASRWGLVEVAWAFDLDLRVHGFLFQRCRDRSKPLFELSEVRSRVNGKNFAELEELLEPDGMALRAEALPLPERGLALGTALVRNGLKTIATTESAWADDIWQLRAESVARRANATIREVVALRRLYGPEVREALTSAIGPNGSGVVRAESRGWELLDERKAWVGRLLVTRWQHSPYDLELYWVSDEHGTLTAVEVQGAWPDPDLRLAIESNVGANLGAHFECAGSVELLVHEVLLTLERPAPESPAR